MDRTLYTRPNKPLRVHVKPRREEAPIRALPEVAAPVTVDRATECHVTPPDVAARMVDYLGPVGDFLTLEPSAGTGNLLAALFESGHSVYETTAIERHPGLAQEVRRRFSGTQHYIDPINRCFLEYAQEFCRPCFPRIIMNPPFSQVRKHMAAALSLLGRCGHQEPAALVALVPVTYRHADAEIMETLPTDTFSTCQVNTKIVRFTR